MAGHFEPFTQMMTEPEEVIRAFLPELSLPPLIACVVHLTGETSILSRLHPPRLVNVVESAESGQDLMEGGYTPAEAQMIHDELMQAIAGFRSGDGKLPQLSTQVTQELLRFMSGGNVKEDYLEFISEEVALDGVDRRAVELDTDALKAAAKEFPVIIIGAGLGGVLAAIRLDEMGIPYTIIEKNPGIGGTWFENKYPGCRVDVSGHSYSYSFRPNHQWTSYYPLADEIRQYFDQSAEEYGVKQHIRFNTEVSQAIYHEDGGIWQVDIVGTDGQRETLKAKAVISAVGQLNRPKMPEIKGLDSFTGAVFHSAQWPDGFDPAGKRMAVIGSGASAFQIIPEMAQCASHLTVFQRSPVWMFPNPAYHTPVGKGQSWALHKLPFYSKWYRFWLFHVATEGVYDKTLVDPDWNKPGSVSASNEELRRQLTAWMESQVRSPDLLEKILPDYPPFGKRILQDNGTYLTALQQPNVELVTSGIVEIVENGVRTADGQLHEVDAIACATGFHADRFLFPMHVEGRDGIVLNEQWSDNNGRAYLGITIPNFPNLFCIYGPNTNLVVAGSIAHNAESQVNYALRCIRMLLESGHDSMACRQDVHDRYNDRVDEVNAGTAWGFSGVENWYKNSEGRVTANLPFRIIDYWKMTRKPDPADFVFD
ncbi:NAD(P)/FAD-dependent oxidoreductase [Croceicoccus sp. F390]|uniref:NAD(P)/FAD-dependent oxidoreductase n=1 Tax=Croceicoccus esteveae TaxID=3075597 RepID=A0ABU2ZH15_9SPHN|nr:NAD(P)/FAD-dependent oxidoreductase [Croceicoccus sp. F390]MDT0575890.1 NAD(P)/FAD-dependent oxidoreductase [Croceicoccus sp. F390]